MKFIDEVIINVTAGRGGDGCMAFRREKFRPMGGPSGGNGGKGGDIILRGDQGMNTLIELKLSPSWRARRGQNGMGKDCFGKGAIDTLIRVPVGTVVRDAETLEELADITAHGQEFIAARGGRGGRGNLAFKTGKRTAPNWAEEGQEGEHHRLLLDLKLIADVALAGLPNAGKSTLIRKISSAQPKVADYPFTTLVPNLGVVRLDEKRSFVVADIPGIIEGASHGAGLGLRFLRHIERTKVVCCLICADQLAAVDPIKAYDILERELQSYSPALAVKPRIVALNKADLPDVKEKAAALKRRFKRRGIDLAVISGLTGQGVRDLLERFWKALEEVRSAPVEP